MNSCETACNSNNSSTLVVGGFRPHSRPIVYLVAVIAILFGQRWARAEEPYQRFLQKLRDEKLFDVALIYVADLEKALAAGAGFATEIPLERALLLQQSASLLPTRASERAGRLDEAEKAFRDFLAKQRQHPRRSEARLELGNLLLTRGEEAKNASKAGSAEPIPEAVKYFGDAYDLFVETQKELTPILVGMNAAKIDPKESARIELRDRYRNEYRRAQLLSGFAIEHRGRSQGVNQPAWKADLDTAQKAYSEVFTKEEGLEFRNLALFYRSGIQRDTGKLDDAIDGYQRVADQEGLDKLRATQTQAVTELIKLWTSPKIAKFPVAIEWGVKWEKQLRPEERTNQEVIDFKLALAQAKLDWATQLASSDGNDRSAPRLKKEVRDLLQPLIRVSGSHQDRVRAMLASVGVERTQSVTAELPKVKSFDEAMAAAQERFERIKAPTIDILKEQLATAEEGDRAKIQEQLTDAETVASKDRSEAIQLIQQALRLVNSKVEREQLQQARFLLGYLMAMDQKPWEAIAIGEFLARSNPGTEIGLDSASIALKGYGDLLKEVSAQSSTQTVSSLRSFAEHLVKTWPTSKPASAAATALVRIAMVNGQWDKAEEYLAIVPPDNGAAAALSRDMGLFMYGQFLEKKQALGSVAADPELNQLRDKALGKLTIGVEGITKENLDQRAIEATNALARMLIGLGRTEEAAKLLNRVELSPLAAIKANPALVSNRNVVLDTYRTHLQVLVGKLGDGADSSETLKEVEQIVTDMRAAAGSDADGKKLLAGIFVGLARDLKELLESTAMPMKKAKIADGLVLLVRQLFNNTEEFITQYWAAQTLSGIAGGLDVSTVPGRQKRTELLAESTNLFSSILDKEKIKPGWIQPTGYLTQIRKEIGIGLRAQGSFQNALDEFSEILQATNWLLDVQVEAARTYQTWGSAGTPEAFKFAIEGGRPDPKKPGFKILWGWGRISQQLAGKPDFEETFYDARYQLAHCRHLYALTLALEKKPEMLERAIRDVTSTALHYPELGGAEMKKKFDALLKKIEADAGKKPLGLAGLQKNAARPKNVQKEASK